MPFARFLSWSQSAQAGSRAEGAADLARTLLFGDLGAEETRAAELALTHALDDPSPVVRRALADALAGAEEAPRHLVVALACDQSDVSSLVLSRSPVLRDADLVDAAALADGYAQAAIAIRPTLSVAVTSALAEVGGRDACVAMSLNPGAEIAAPGMSRMIERFGDDAELREALLARDDLPPSVRHELAAATARALVEMVTARGWLAGERSDRLLRDSRERAAVIIASEAESAPLDLARHLRRVGQLTPGLLLRSLLSGDRAFFAAALADLSGLAVARVQGLMRDPSSAAFLAMCERSGLPATLLPAFRAAVAATRGAAIARDGGLSLPIVSAVVDACEANGGETLGKVMSLLRRFEAEAARDEARRVAEETQRAAREQAEALAQGEPTLAILDVVDAVEAVAKPEIETVEPVELPLDLRPTDVDVGAPVMSLDDAFLIDENFIDVAPFDGETSAPEVRIDPETLARPEPAARRFGGFRLPLFGGRAA